MHYSQLEHHIRRTVLPESYVKIQRGRRNSAGGHALVYGRSKGTPCVVTIPQYIGS
jgi:hypothetical protein